MRIIPATREDTCGVLLLPFALIDTHADAHLSYSLSFFRLHFILFKFFCTVTRTSIFPSTKRKVPSEVEKWDNFIQDLSLLVECF